MRRSFAVLVSLLLLAACDSGTSLKTLQATAPVADPYQAALAQGYKQFADAEAADADWNTSEYLAAKGLDAAQGKLITPENPSTWDISITAHPEFVTARDALNEAVTANKSTQPMLTAQAMLAYDHWVIATHNQTDAGRIAQRQADFTAALAQLHDVHTAQPGIPAPSSEPLPPHFDPSGHVIFYFPFDSDKLGSSASTAIHQLAGQIIAHKKANVSLNGHTDRAGSDQYNMALSERRARFVQRALIDAGAPVKQLHYFAFGESDPAVPTADGVREPRNRRVEVVVE